MAAPDGPDFATLLAAADAQNVHRCLAVLDDKTRTLIPFLNAHNLTTSQLFFAKFEDFGPLESEDYKTPKFAALVTAMKALVLEGEEDHDLNAPLYNPKAVLWARKIHGAFLIAERATEKCKVGLLESLTERTIPVPTARPPSSAVSFGAHSSGRGRDTTCDDVATSDALWSHMISAHCLSDGIDRLPSQSLPDKRVLLCLASSLSSKPYYMCSFEECFPKISADSKPAEIAHALQTFCHCWNSLTRSDIQDDPCRWIRESQCQNYPGTLLHALRPDGSRVRTGSSVAAREAFTAYIASFRNGGSRELFTLAKDIFNYFSEHLVDSGCPLDAIAFSLSRDGPKIPPKAVTFQPQPAAPSRDRRDPPRRNTARDARVDPRPSRRGGRLDDDSDDLDDELARAHRSYVRDTRDMEFDTRQPRAPKRVKSEKPPKRDKRSRPKTPDSDPPSSDRVTRSARRRAEASDECESPGGAASEYLAHWGGSSSSTRPCFSKQKYPGSRYCLHEKPEREGEKPRECDFSHDPFYLKCRPDAMWCSRARRA